MGSAKPRPVRWRGRAALLRRLLWNIWGMMFVVTLFATRQIHEPAALCILVFIAFVLPSLLLFVKERQWRRQIHLLRTGIAVSGWVSSGTVTSDRGISIYRINYHFPVAQKIREEEVRVTAEEFRSLIYGNPYNTVLYDANNASNCLLYSQVKSVYLA